MTGTIEHPNVVPIHYLDAEADGSPLIVLKRIEGVEWSALINNAAEVERRFDWGIAVSLRDDGSGRA